MMFVLSQRVYIYALWLIVTRGLLLVTVTGNPALVCPGGWYKHNGKCYWFSDFKTTREDAKLQCESRNSSLVTITTSNINNVLQQYIFNDTNYWIGLRIHEVLTSRWQWSSGENWVSISHYKYINWCTGYVIETACAAATFSSSNQPHICYDSYICGTEQRYVCEKEKRSLSSCPEGWDNRTYTGVSTKCYYVSVDTLSNMEAARFCWSKGARLITVTHNGPQVYLLNKKPGPNEVYWIGLSPYKWDDGSPYHWNNWDADGPSIGAHCTLLQQCGTWHYGFCADLNNFICQNGGVISTTTTTKTTITTATTSPEIPSFSSSDMPSTSSVSIISTTSQLTTMYTTYTSAIANDSSHTEMLLEKSTPTSHSELALHLMIGVYTAVGVVFVVFVGLLVTCLVLRKRHISRMKNMSIEQETQFSEIAPHDGDVDYIYDSPEIVQIEEATQPQNSSSVDVTKSTLSTGTGVVLNDASSSTSQNAFGSNTIAQTKSFSIKDTTRNGVITKYANSNEKPPQQEAADTISSAAGLAHTSVSPRHVSINGEVYAEVDMSRKTIGYDDVILPQPATNDQCEQSKRSKILSPTCNQDEPPDLEDTSENVYYNESAQPIYSNEVSDHDLENQYNNAVSSDTCDTDNSMNDEETYANCGDETGGVAYTEVDLSEPTSNMPTTEEEGVVYSDIKM